MMLSKIVKVSLDNPPSSFKASAEYFSLIPHESHGIFRKKLFDTKLQNRKKVWRGFNLPMKEVEKRLKKQEMISFKEENGKTKIYTLQEVEVTEEVEKWVKIEKSKNTYNKKSEVKPETAEQPITETTNTETVDSNISEYELIITADVDTRDNSPLWVVKIIDKLSKEEYKNVASEFGKLKGYYSKFKHGFIFKYDPSAVLKSESVEQEQQETEKTTEEIITEANTKEILGEKLVSGLKYERKGKIHQLNVHGVIVEIGRMPNSNFVKGFLKMDKHNHINIDCSGHTSVEGVFAAGDCTSVHEYQYVISAGEGCTALIKAARYLANKK